MIFFFHTLKPVGNSPSLKPTAQNLTGNRSKTIDLSKWKENRICSKIRSMEVDKVPEKFQIDNLTSETTARFFKLTTLVFLSYSTDSWNLLPTCLVWFRWLSIRVGWYVRAHFSHNLKNWTGKFVSRTWLTLIKIWPRILVYVIPIIRNYFEFYSIIISMSHKPRGGQVWYIGVQTLVV